MGRLFPALDPAEIKNPGERAVARVLVKQFPDSVEIYHGFNWVRRNPGGRFDEGECDFVLLHRKRGLLFVEVKGGALSFRDGRWVRFVGSQARCLPKDPFDQVQRNMRSIIRVVKQRFGGPQTNLPFTYGYAVMFPDSKFSGTLPPSFQPELLLDAVGLKTARSRVLDVFRGFRRPHHRSLTAREFDSVKEALYPRYDLLPVLWRRIEDQEAKLHRLTDRQKGILDILANQPRAAIRGVAGSGKTLIAVAKAQQAARAGHRTLLLCYNSPLRNWLRHVVPESNGGELVIQTYHGLARHLCREDDQRRWDRWYPKDDEFWNTIAPEALEEACARLGPQFKFDAVVVDEGQDFRELWWASLEGVFRNPGAKDCYYVFYDPMQNLYVDEPCLPEELGPPYLLTDNCRNTTRIVEHCAALAGYKAQTRPEAPEGDQPTFVSVPTLRHAIREAGREVRKLCISAHRGLRKSQVAVLAPPSRRREWPSNLGAIPLTSNLDDWRANRKVLIDSWGRFKGLEADAIVSIELSARTGKMTDVQRYVARSRAKHLLVVIEVDEKPDLPPF